MSIDRDKQERMKDPRNEMDVLRSIDNSLRWLTGIQLVTLIIALISLSQLAQ